MLSSGPICQNSIRLLIITTDFVALYQYVVFIITSFLAGVDSGEQCLLNSTVLSCFSGAIMSIRSFFSMYGNFFRLNLMSYISITFDIQFTSW